MSYHGDLLFTVGTVYCLTVIVNKAVLKFDKMLYLGTYKDKMLFCDVDTDIVSLLLSDKDIVKSKML